MKSLCHLSILKEFKLILIIIYNSTAQLYTFCKDVSVMDTGEERTQIQGTSLLLIIIKLMAKNK